MAIKERTLCPICNDNLISCDKGLKCENCGIAFSKEDDQKKITLYEEAFYLLSSSQFSLAFEKFSAYTKKYSDDFIGYWGKALSKFFIKFKEGKPLCLKYTDVDFTDDEDFLKAHEFTEYKDRLDVLAKDIQKTIDSYQKESDKINYDVFLLANEECPLYDIVYEKLKKNNYSVFYSPKMNFKEKDVEQITAISMDKSKVLFCNLLEKEDFENPTLNWRRFYILIKSNEKADNSLIFTYKDIKKDDFPKELKNLYFLDSTKENAEDIILKIVDMLLKQLITGPLNEQLKLEEECEEVKDEEIKAPARPPRPPKPKKEEKKEGEKEEKAVKEKRLKSKASKLTLAIVLPIVLTAVLVVAICVPLIWAPQVKTRIKDDSSSYIPEKDDYIDDGGTASPIYINPISPELYAIKNAVKNNGYYLDGDYIWFGEYPQVLKPNLVNITTTKNDKGYYLGDDGEYYAEITASLPMGKNTNFSNGKSIKDGESYYFRIDPIKWRIGKFEENKYFLISNIVLDAMIFGNTKKYDDSEIRRFLRDDFIKDAFTEAQKNMIIFTNVNNSIEDDKSLDVEDKIFILNKSEAENPEYGFKPNNEEDALKSLFATDYARAKGVSIDTNGNGSWWTRSHTNKDFIYCILGKGEVQGAKPPTDIYGLVPTMNILFN